ncbi:MAG: NAD-glutamate dehydrogenase domain-containing protein, partial [Actinomycetales bacterium]
MPFLVASVTSELAREGRTVRVVIHPLLTVRRDADGGLVDVLDVDIDDERPAGAIAESWMRIEMERDYLAQDDVELTEHIVRILADVRAAVEDWAQMCEHALHISADLRVNPPVLSPGNPADAVSADDVADLMQWLVQDHFTFLGYREYQVNTSDGLDELDVLPATGLGILRDANSGDVHLSKSFAELAEPVRARIHDPQILQVNKANIRSTVHRDADLDYIGIKTFDDAGRVAGERRFLGLFTASAYAEPLSEVPGLARKLQAVLEALQLVPGSHSAKDLQQFLQTYPRDELFQLSIDELVPIAEAAMHLQDRRQTKLFTRVDDYGRYVSCIVYLPRDRYTTTVRQGIEQLLVGAFDGVGTDYTAWVTENVLARVHYVIHLAPGTDPTQVRALDLQRLQADVARAARSWEDDFTDAMVATLGEAEAMQLLPRYLGGYSTAYKAAFSAEQAVRDAVTLERLAPGELDLELRWMGDADADQARFTVIRIGPAMSLSRILPILQAMGAEVIDERPYQVDGPDGAQAWVLDFGLILTEIALDARADAAERFCAGFEASWSGQCESDPLNALILLAGLTWQEVVLVRALVRYIRQIGVAFGQEYIHQALLANADIVAMQVRLFNDRLNPGLRDSPDKVAASDQRAEQGINAITRALDAVPSLDQDRILRLLLVIVTATLRTNVYAQERPDRFSYAFKIDSGQIADLPQPRPWVEIWVYSPRVEGVHLRRGSVARGGLRWSDRREDLRTEILGLVKAQEVKNSVIVPVGAKGGFCPASLPDPAVDRDAWMREGQACYREFVSALLDLTDNLVDGVVVPPPDVVRRDGDDPYLVVAADKGTATFSDLANSIAAEYDFWLGDAFASGGSAGYDHKAMGITARGAWESVRRHFREIDLDPQTEDFTVAGVGDMSGDVFGNG